MGHQYFRIYYIRLMFFGIKKSEKIPSRDSQFMGIRKSVNNKKDHFDMKPNIVQLWMKGSYLLCPQKHALKTSPSVNTSSPNTENGRLFS